MKTTYSETNWLSTFAMRRLALGLLIAITTQLGAFGQTSVKVFLLGGQSNMVGYNDVNSQLPLVLQGPQNNVTMKAFGWENAFVGWGPVRPGAGKNSNSFGPEISFAWDIARSYPGENIAIIKGSYSGTNIYKQWRSPSAGRVAGEGGLYDSYVSEVNKALTELRAKYTTVTIEGLCWMQGESDAGDTEAHAQQYEANLGFLLKDFRAAFKAPRMPVAIAMIDASTAWKYNAIVRTAEVNVAKTLPGVYVFDTKGYPTDNVHYTAAGQLRLGADFAMVLKNRISPVLSNGVAALFQDCGYEGYQRDFTTGDYSLAQLLSAGVKDNDISSLKLMKAFKATVYADDNFGGSSVDLVQDNACLVANAFNDLTSAVKIRSKGVRGKAGVYLLKNQFSGLNAELWQSGLQDGNNFVQWPFHGQGNQQFKFEEVEAGIYKITNVASGKALGTPEANKSNGVVIEQRGWQNTRPDSEKVAKLSRARQT